MAAHSIPGGDAENHLAMAIIGSSAEPLLLLNPDLTVIAASASFCHAFDIDAGSAAGQMVTALGAGEWNVPQLKSLLRATASGRAKISAYEMDLFSQGRTPRRLVLSAENLSFGSPARQLLMLAVADVTDQRLAEKVRDDLLRDKAIMLQELQHRVANSLQIIASVLLQSARKVQSDETRSHLHNAHNRVMSVAALQRQLATTGEADVQVGEYLTELCDSIGASMIRDPDQLTIRVDADGSFTNSDRSVSLGLMVTELVINALKHAFPDERAGKIVVAYRATGAGWWLSVTDDGVGMPEGGVEKPGLGTSIVHALATQLNANVKIVDMKPGTAVWVSQGSAIDPSLNGSARLALTA
jgi:two-component sensor histidine kinase